MKTSFKTLFILIAFSVAMGFLETAVVVYLRNIYYPEGFHLPLKVIDPHIALVEILREAATLMMLISIAMLTGKSSIQRFAFFLLCFGIWDLFYYVFLKVFLNWPASLLDGDVLFLIPLPWIGPVLAPCILSLTMMLVALVFLKKENILSESGIGWKNILLMITGSCIVIYSFIMDYKDYVQVDSKTASVFKSEIHEYNWRVFITGELLILIPVLLMTVRKSNERR